MTPSRSTGPRSTPTEGATPMLPTRLDPTATRYALRGWTPWLLLLITGAYVTMGAIASSLVTFIYAACFLAFVGVTLHWRYRTDIERREREAEAATYAAERAERMAQHDEAMARIEQARQAALQVIEDAVSRGERCPDDCVACIAERTESDAETRAWLAARAARHGHLA